jgi:hypothetical protein
VFSILQQFCHLMLENVVRMKLFIWPFLSHYDKNSVKDNTVWKNVIYSITNHDIDMKIQYNMDPCMAHIFVTVNFSEKCLFMGVIFIFRRQDRSGISR